jgi:hypothetical protein
MIPPIKALAVTFGFVVKDKAMKSTPIKERNQLTK